MIHNGMRPVHPGEILREEFMAPLGLSANALARELRDGGEAISASKVPREGLHGGEGLLQGKPHPISSRRAEATARSALPIRSSALTDECLRGRCS